MKKLQYGMVGGGPGSLIGDAHRRSINIDGQAKLVAGCFSRNPEKCRQTGEELGIDPERCYASYEEMARAEAGRLDYVVVVVPNVSHYPVCKAFLEAGIHVSCDKPLCLTVEEADELVALAKAKDLLFMVTYTYTGHVTAKHVRSFIESGKLGKIRTVMAEYPQGWLAYEGEWGGKQGEWRCDPKQSGGVNCLGDLGTHVENMVSMMTGLKIKRVLAKMDKLVPGRVLDDNDLVLVEYEGGAVGSYWTTQVAIGRDNDLAVRIYGENGSIEWKQTECEKVLIVARDGTLIERHRGNGGIEADAAKYGRLPSGHNEGWLEAMGNLYRSFMECIRAKADGSFTPDMIDFQTVEDGAEGVKFVHACLKSSNEGNIWVEL